MPLARVDTITTSSGVDATTKRLAREMLRLLVLVEYVEVVEIELAVVAPRTL